MAWGGVGKAASAQLGSSLVGSVLRTGLGCTVRRKIKIERATALSGPLGERAPPCEAVTFMFQMWLWPRMAGKQLHAAVTTGPRASPQLMKSARNSDSILTESPCDLDERIDFETPGAKPRAARPAATLGGNAS